MMLRHCSLCTITVLCLCSFTHSLRQSAVPFTLTPYSELACARDLPEAFFDEQTSGMLIKN